MSTLLAEKVLLCRNVLNRFEIEIFPKKVEQDRCFKWIGQKHLLRMEIIVYSNSSEFLRK